MYSVLSSDGDYENKVNYLEIVENRLEDYSK